MRNPGLLFAPAAAAILVTLIPPSLAQAQASCTAERAALEATARGLSVRLEAPARTRAGDPFALVWTGHEAFAGRTPVFLILAAPADVRFAGDYRPLKSTSGVSSRMEASDPSEDPEESHVVGPGFFAVTGSVRGPLSIAFGMGRLRAIVPLQGNPAEFPQRVVVRAYQDGPLSLDWALVASGPCGEWTLAGAKLAPIPIYSGAPEIVVFDKDVHRQPAAAPRAAQPSSVPKGKAKSERGLQPVTSMAVHSVGGLDRPVDVVLSKSGAYRLHIYQGRYLVFDTASETLILDRAGDKPAFSPTSRFVAAVVAARDTEEEEGGAKQGTRFEIIDLVSRQVEITADGYELGWALGDALVIANGANGGNGVEVWPTLVGNAAFGSVGKQTYSVMNKFDYKLDAWRDLRLSIGLDGGVFEMGRSAESVLAYGLATSQRVTCVSPVGCFSGSIADRLNPIWRGPNRWQLEGGFAFTHTARTNGARPPPMVKHTSLMAVARPTGVQPVDSRRSLRAGIGWRSLVAVEGTAATALRGFQDELERFGITLASNESPESLVSWRHGPSRDEDTAQFKYPVARIEGEMRAMVPDARMALQRTPVMADMTGDIPKIFLATHARGLWRWQLGAETLWLVQVLTIQGSGGFGYGGLYLFRSGKGVPGAIANLTETLGEDRLSRYGAIGTDPQIKAYVSQSRYLMLAAPLGRALAIYDLEQGRALIQITEVEKTFLVESLHMTADGRYLIQRNQDGSLALFAIATGRRIMSGRYVDGEIILYDDQGHYDATYEGGHFVHLRFPGTSGLHTFHQFSAKLKRPDILRALLKGGSVTEDAPQISAPPTIEAAVTEISDQQIALRVVARAREGLATLRIYQDGLLTQEVVVTGSELVQTLVVARSGGARRLAVVASDLNDVFSLPAEHSLPPSSVAAGRLRGVAVGVDIYQDRRIARLAFAATDAANLSRAISGGSGKRFSSIDLAPVTDSAATPSRVLELLEQAVVDARPGDTVVFFFSGHGLRSRSGEFFFATSGTDPDSPQTTALAWSSVGEILRRSKARVLVLIDACHSGLAGELAFASNDDAVAQMMSGLRAPIVILAASKGRQLSQELASIRGGAFTRALEAVIGKERSKYDVDQSGTIEISELYAGVKQLVLETTGGQQTPWLARSDMIGDFTLF